jgi:hypothetical protein
MAQEHLRDLVRDANWHVQESDQLPPRALHRGGPKLPLVPFTRSVKPRLRVFEALKRRDENVVFGVSISRRPVTLTLLIGVEVVF